MFFVQLIPATFLFERTSLSLSELKWAFDAGIVGARTIVDFAANRLALGSCEPMLIELGAISDEDLGTVRDTLRNVVIDPTSEEEIRRKWVWLVLLWVYENRQDLELFETISELYADLGYPAEMYEFAPYGPAFQGNDPAETKKRVVRALMDYVECGRAEFGLPGRPHLPAV